ncbi:hypothetical protein GHT06_010985 [Daphnia sinensis]|uniref:Uncharacterized protein n=1 Tax=Daphnia sinensis TaxID=1820382 RepID=A0AAD5PXX8_9CRUS|nr:hypothetical protein GHT06_010985 [Daphnia sinensis]
MQMEQRYLKSFQLPLEVRQDRTNILNRFWGYCNWIEIRTGCMDPPLILREEGLADEDSTCAFNPQSTRWCLEDTFHWRTACHVDNNAEAGCDIEADVLLNGTTSLHSAKLKSYWIFFHCEEKLRCQNE